MMMVMLMMTEYTLPNNRFSRLHIASKSLNTIMQEAYYGIMLNSATKSLQ